MQINNNCILISIQPKWCQLIGNLRKTLEVRKNIPKLKPPFKCYIYCTKANYLIDRKFLASNMVSRWIESYSEDIRDTWPCDGTVIGEFICTGFKEINTKSPTYIADEILDESCLTVDQIRDYANGAEMLYGWIIKDLKLYKKPKSLSQFKQTKVIRGYHKNKLRDNVSTDLDYLLKSKRLEIKYFDRAPQSWCYCNELSEE